MTRIFSVMRWNQRQKSELIESVIMGIPLPLIYLAENEDGKLVVVDGRQRLSTFFEFLDDKFKLKNLKILSQINGMSMKEMDADPVYSRYATTIEDTQLVVQIIYKFRCKNPKRCFGYRKNDVFHVLRMERDHKISDNG